MSVDCEGFDMEVLESNDWNEFRPTLISIEHSMCEHVLNNFMKSKNYIMIFQNVGNTFFKDNIQ